MPSTILGTYPITSSQTNSRDEYGIEVKSWVFTVKTSDLLSYLPKKDDPYAGPGVTAPTTNPYRVTQAEARNLSGDLTEVSVSATGSQFNTGPVVSLISGCPFIFGLKGGAGAGNALGLGYATSGFGVQVSFVVPATNNSENSAVATYLYKIMPGTFMGVSLPAPARSPFFQEFYQTFSSDEFAGGEQQRKTGELRYQGYIADEITFRRHGGATLVNLIYREKGSLYYLQWSGNTGTASFVYNFTIN